MVKRKHCNSGRPPSEGYSDFHTPPLTDTDDLDQAGHTTTYSLNIICTSNQPAVYAKRPIFTVTIYWNLMIALAERHRHMHTWQNEDGIGQQLFHVLEQL